MPDVEKGTSLSRSQFLNLTYLTSLALLLEACGINTETPTLTPQQKKLNKIDFNSPSPDTKNVQDDIFSIYPELKQLEQIQKEIIIIGPTDIEIINLSRTYVTYIPDRIATLWLFSLAKNTSKGVKYPRHLLGRLLISSTTSSISSWVTVLKSVPLGKYLLRSPL